MKLSTGLCAALIALAGLRVSATAVPAYWGVHAQNQTAVLPGEAEMAASAFTMFRTFYNWADIEYAPGQYNFEGPFNSSSRG